MNKQIRNLFAVIVVLFGLLIVWTTRWTVIDAKSLRNNPLNDRTLVQELLDGAVHGAHTELRARLHAVFQLIEFALTDQVRRGRSIDQDLQGRHASLLVGPLQQLLRNHAAQ